MATAPDDVAPPSEEKHPAPATDARREEARHLKLLRPIASPDQIAQAQREVSVLIVQSLKEGQDYGTIPGAGDKKVLLKAGAERLAIAFGCRIEYEVVEKEIDHDRPIAFALPRWTESDRRPSKEEAEQLKAQGTGRWRKGRGGKWVWQDKSEERGEAFGLYRYVIRCRLVRHDGLVVGDAIGSCSSLESKYIRQPRDSENTIVKMAQKRALVAVALNAFGLSDRFTQDLEELPEAIALEPVTDRCTEPRPEPDSAAPTAPNRDDATLAELLQAAPEGEDAAPYRRYLAEHRARLSPSDQGILRAWLRARHNVAQGRAEEHDNDASALSRAKEILPKSAPA